MHYLFPMHSHWRYPALAVYVAEAAYDHGPASRITLAASRGRSCYDTWLVGSVVTLALIPLAMARFRSGWAPQTFVQAMLVTVRPWAIEPTTLLVYSAEATLEVTCTSGSAASPRPAWPLR